MNAISANRPAPAPIRPFQFPPARTLHLDSGLRVVICHLPGARLASVRLVAEAGPVAEPDGQGGVAALAGATVTLGTAHLDADALSDAIDRLGAVLTAAVDRDVLRFSLDLPASRLESGLRLLSEVVVTPAFPAAEVARARDARLTVLRNRRLDAGGRGMVELLHAIYTPRSTYWREVAGELDSVSGLGAEEVAGFYGTFATPGSATLIVGADLSQLAVEPLLEDLFGGWHTPEPKRGELVIEDALQSSRVLLIHRPGAVQSSLTIGHLGVSRAIPDLLAAAVLLGKLGAGMGSRINYRLREEKGYTYAAGFSVEAHRGAGPMAALTSVETAVTADAVATVVAELELMKAGGVSPDEMREEVDQMVGRFPVAYQTPAAICDALANIQVWGLASDWLDTYRDRAAALTLEEVNATSRYLHPECMATIVVGDAEQVAEPLRQLGLASLTVIEDEGSGEAT